MQTERSNRIIRKLVLGATVASSLFASALARAYIPSSRTIAVRLAKGHGKGFYAIEQEVQFRTTTEPMTLRERWVIENGENMRLTVISPKAAQEVSRFDAVYHDGKRTASDLRGGLRTTAYPAEFAEPFEYVRSGRGFLDSLVRAGIVPGAFLRERPRTVKQGNFTYGNEPLVRLGRSSGIVAWIFGEPTPVDARKLKPSAWIEQDSFLLRRLRFPTEAEITLDKHSTFTGGLKLPRERTFTWGGNSAVVRVLSVKAVTPAQASSLLTAGSISANDARAARLPDQAQVREFYSRFR
jgi:hypothetical protein